MQNIKLSLIQAPLQWEDRKANLEYFTRCLLKLDNDVDLVVLPEMFSTGFSMRPEEFAETEGGLSLLWMREQARILESAICGSVMVADKGRFVNRFYFVYPDGEYRQYDKKHLFRMGEEPKHFSAGEERVIIEYKSWKILLQVCYDLRFPVYTANSWHDGDFAYDAMIYVANWPAARANAWKTLLRARAIENQAVVAGVNRIGEDGNGLPHSGDSCLINERGEAMIEFAADEEGIRSAVIKRQQLYDFREKFPVSRDWDRFEIQ